MTPDERLVLHLFRALAKARYSLPHVLALMVIAGFVGHFL